MKKRIIAFLLSTMMLSGSFTAFAAEPLDTSLLGASEESSVEASVEASTEGSSEEEEGEGKTDEAGEGSSEKSDESGEGAGTESSANTGASQEESATGSDSSDSASSGDSEASDAASSASSDEAALLTSLDKSALDEELFEGEKQWLIDHHMTKNADGMYEYIDENGKLWIYDPNDPEFWKYFNDPEGEAFDLNEEDLEELLVTASSGRPDPYTVPFMGKKYAYPSYYKTSDEDARVRVRCGLDISKYQGEVSVSSFESMKEKGVDYVIIRAGFRGYGESGSLNDDPCFKHNVENAYEAGLWVGAYYFSQAITRSEAVREAEEMIKLVKPLKSKIKLPLMIDYEYSDPRGQGRMEKAKLSKDAHTKIVNAFCSTITDSGYQAGIYADKSMFTKDMNFSSIGEKNYIWLANWVDAKNGVYSTSFSGRLNCWQITSNFKGFGSEGKKYFANDRVDVNLWYGDFPNEKCKLVLVANNGTSLREEIEDKPDTPVTLPECKFVKKGCDFVEWNTKANGKGTGYAPGYKFKLTKEKHTLYAIWKYIDYKVTFDPNGGTTDTTQMIMHYDGKPYGTLPVAKKEGCFFLGWFTEKEGGTVVTIKSKLADAKDQTLYAHWEEIQPATLSLNYSKLTLEKGDERKLAASMFPEIPGITVTWSSSDAETVSVTDGTIKALKAGEAVITASIPATTKAGESEKITASCEVTVFAPEIENEETERAETFETPKGLWILDFKDSFQYTGGKIKPSFKVYYGTSLLRAGTDYSVTYKNNVKAGTASVVIQGKGNFSGKCTKQFTITPVELKQEDMEDIDKPLDVDVQTGVVNKGKAVKPSVVVRYAGKALKVKKDYTLEYEEITEEGTAKLTVKGKGNYTGEVVKDFTVKSAATPNISKCTVKFPQKSYTLEEMKDTDTVASGIELFYKKELVEKSEYRLKFENCDKVGKGTIVILPTDTGSFAGQKRVTVKITGKKLVSMVLSETAYTYNGIAQFPEVTVFPDKKGEEEPIASDCYKVSYSTNRIKAGTVTVTVTGDASKGYTGKLTKKYKINALPVADGITNGSISVKWPENVVFTKGGVTPPVTVTFTDASGSGKKWVLRQGVDYTLKYANNKAISATKDPTVTVVGKGNFKGSSEAKTFVIKKRDISSLPISCKNVKANYRKKGSYYYSKPVIIDGNGKALTDKTDYTVKYINMATGKPIKSEVLYEGAIIKADITATGKNYTGKAAVFYKVEKAPQNIASTSVKLASQKKAGKIPNQKYTGKPIELEGLTVQITKTVGKKKVTETLEEGKHYKITGYYNNTKKGTASVRIEGMGDYCGYKLVKFKIVAASTFGLFNGSYKEGELVGFQPTTITLSDQSIQVGEKVKLVPTYAPEKCDIPAVTWKSSNTKVVTVDKYGNIKGKARGTAVITVTSSQDKTKKGTATITVSKD
ncbi:MAG: InlB B-repeat-containing protein [Butyrivibrio sp.]|nr:InlB B-repeat-containing protein [Butyrivibrio sp.]